MYSQVIPTEALIKKKSLLKILISLERECVHDRQQEQGAHERRAGADSRRVGLASRTLTMKLCSVVTHELDSDSQTGRQTATR